MSDTSVVVVTGGTSGIGRACAEAFARRGARVAIFGIEDAAGREVVEAIDRAGGHAAYFRVDVRSRDDIARGVAEVSTQLGDPDVLISNAGIVAGEGDTGGAEGVEDDLWHDILETNLTASYRLVRALAPGMRSRRRGSIVLMSSYAAFRGLESRQSLAYAVSKGGLVTLGRHLALAYGTDGVRCNVICPYYIDTPLNQALLATEADREREASRIPLRRIGSADDVANVVVFLASPAAAYITGQTIIVDGGIDVVIPE